MHKVFMKIDHIVVCKYNKFNKSRLILTISYSHARKLDINNKVKKQEDFSKLKKYILCSRWECTIKFLKKFKNNNDNKSQYILESAR